MVVGGLLVVVVAAAGLALVLKASSATTPSTPATLNSVDLTGALTLSESLSSSCRLGAAGTLYAFDATFADPKHSDTRFHYELGFEIKRYHGPGTYQASDSHLDNVVLVHYGAAANGVVAADAIYQMTDRSGQASVNPGGLMGAINQDVVKSPGRPVHVSARWQCEQFAPQLVAHTH